MRKNSLKDKQEWQEFSLAINTYGMQTPHGKIDKKLLS